MEEFLVAIIINIESNQINQMDNLLKMIQQDMIFL